MTQPIQPNATSSSVEDHTHPAYLAHHFKTMDQQTSSGKLGMWVFMSQELLFFSGLFCAFGYVRYMYPEMLLEAQGTMDWVIGGINTVVLLVSSLTMSLCVHATRSLQYEKAKKFLIITFLLGFTFLCIKGSEWAHHMHEGYLPGKYFSPHVDALVQNPLAHIFFGLYYVMTGMHGLHVIIGLGIMIWMYTRIRKKEFNRDHYVALENTSLFWHLVDIVWIFLYPTLYLIK
jgi:cytochrome c oxidase subunit 3